MKQFEVGDKVRRIRYAGDLELGKVYTVSNVSITGFIGVKEWQDHDDKTPFDVINFELVPYSDVPDKSESEIVKAWIHKLWWLNDNTEVYVPYNINVEMEDGTILRNEESVDFVINSYEAYRNKAKQKEKQELLDKKAALELQLAQINEQLGE